MKSSRKYCTRPNTVNKHTQIRRGHFSCYWFKPSQQRDSPLLHPYSLSPQHRLSSWFTLPFLLVSETRVEPCEGVQCRPGAECTVGEGGEPECRCRSHCLKDDSRRTVCGSDGTDYSSECELTRTSCLLQQKVRVRYAGMCGECLFFLLLFFHFDVIYLLLIVFVCIVALLRIHVVCHAARRGLCYDQRLFGPDVVFPFQAI